MPTITTTVTSSEANGATTTMTTTQATPEPPAVAAKAVAANLPGHRGGIVARQIYNFASTQDRDDFIAALAPIPPLVNAIKPNQMQAYIYHTSPTEFQAIFQWANPDAFFEAERMFGTLETVTGMMGTYTHTAHFGGNVGPVQSRLDEWSKAPGFTILVDNNGLYFTDCLPADRTTQTAVADMEFATGAEMDTFLETWDTCNGVFNQSNASQGCIRTSPTHATMILVGRSKAATLQHFHDVQQPELAPLMTQVANMTNFSGFVFGNIEDAEIKAGMEAWPTFKAVPTCCGNNGGDEILLLMVYNYDTKALRDECLANLATADWCKGENTFFSVPKGETSCITVHRCANYAACQELQACYASGEKIFPDLQKCDSVKAYLGGNLVKEWQDDMDGWMNIIGGGGVMQRDDSQIIIQTAGAKLGANAFHFYQRLDYNGAEGFQALRDLWCQDGDILNGLAGAKGGTSCNWKVGESAVIVYAGFESSEDWLLWNEVVKVHAEAISKHIKKLDGHIMGPISAELKAACDEWNAAPWCNIAIHDKTFGKSVYN